MIWLSCEQMPMRISVRSIRRIPSADQSYLDNAIEYRQEPSVRSKSYAGKGRASMSL